MPPANATLAEFLKKYNPATPQEGLVFINGYWQGIEAAFNAMRQFGPAAVEDYHREASDAVWAKLKELGAV